MAYFDSSKNRALWDIRLGELRKARAAREAGETTGIHLTEQTASKTVNPTRVRVTYKELLQEEMKATEKRRPVREREMTKAKEKTQEGPRL